jgi:mRNA-degrading endonuclease RelE of RelBE toxin-antitoxin system
MANSLRFKRGALGEFERLARRDQEAFAEAFDLLIRNPTGWDPDLNIRAIRGRPGLWRLAVGPWRAFYRVDGEVIRIVAFRHRASAYHE